MGKKSNIIIIAGIFIAILIAALWGYNSLSKDYNSPNDTTGKSDPNSTSKEDEYEHAPDFTVFNASGEKVLFSSLSNGKPIVINFWASWCGPCKSEMPDFQAVYEDKGSDINFVMINLTDGFRETQSRADKFISSSGYTFPVYYDTEGDASGKYGVYSIPTTCFINAKGRIVDIHTGVLEKDELLSYIDKID